MTRAKLFSLLLPDVFKAHPTSYPMDIEGSLLGVKSSKCINNTP
jgi:hypothetical protein